MSQIRSLQTHVKGGSAGNRPNHRTEVQRRVGPLREREDPFLLLRDRAVALGALVRGVIVRDDGDHLGRSRLDGCDRSGRCVGRVDVVFRTLILLDDTLAVLVPNLSFRAFFDHDAAVDTVLFHRGRRRAVRTCEATISRVL